MAGTALATLDRRGVDAVVVHGSPTVAGEVVERQIRTRGSRIIAGMEPSVFDEVAFFRALDGSGARALLIGRRALVLLGLPVLTADYDFWLSIDDIPAFNAVGTRFDLHPNRTPEEARRHGRYVLENDEHIDVLVSRSVPTIDGHVLDHDALWTRRRAVSVADTKVYLPSLDDLILTKQVATRPKDLEDIRLLRILKENAQ